MVNRLRRVVNEYRSTIDHRIAHTYNVIAHAHQQTLQHVNNQLQALYQEMQTAQAQEKQQLRAQWLYENTRLETIQRLVTNQIDQFAALAKMQVASEQYQAVRLGGESAQLQLQATVPNGVNWSFGVPNPDAVQNLIGATRNGSPLADLFDGFGSDAAKNVTHALITGIELGMNPNDIALMVQHALDIPLWRAQTIARTEMLRAYRSSALLNYRANSDVVHQWRWTASLSARTCSACIAMDGSLHDLDEELDSHVNCRCVAVPVTRSWLDILSDAGVDAPDTLDISETSYSAPSGSDWFAKQDTSLQKDVLGPGRYALYKNGDIALDDVVGHEHDPDWGSSIYVKSLKTLSQWK